MIDPAELALLEWRQPLAGLLALLPLAALWLARRRSRRIAGWADTELQAWAMQPAATPPGLRLRIALEALGWILLAIALAGPRMAVEAPREDGSSRERAALHVTLLVQTTHAMREADAAPSPLERSRLALHDLAARHAGESLSLIVWGASPGLLLPATRDAALLTDAAHWLDTELVPGGAARLDRALALALTQPLPTDTARHAIVLITDADATALDGAELPATANALRAQDIPLFVLLADARTARNTAFGQGRHDPAAFAALAGELGGTQAALDAPGHGWPQIHAQGLARIALPPPPPERAVRWQSLHAAPLALALLMLLAAYSPWPRRLMRVAPVLALLALGVPPPAQAQDPALTQRAWQAFEQGQWSTAQRLYARAGGHTGHHGAGVAALQAQRPNEALSHLELAWMLAPDTPRQLDALYNLGHAHAAFGRWDAALAAWMAVLEARPDDRAAGLNVQVARDELRRRSLADERAQDLYARRGVFAEGHIQPEGAKDEEPPALRSESATASGTTLTSAAETAARDYMLAPDQLDAGRSKVERLGEDRLRLRQGLLQQDRGARLPTEGGQ